MTLAAEPVMGWLCRSLSDAVTITSQPAQVGAFRATLGDNLEPQAASPKSAAGFVFRQEAGAMRKVAIMLAIGLVLSPAWSAQTRLQSQCMERCMTEQQEDPDVQRAEIVNLEVEAAHAIRLGDAAFFHRVYADDFNGTLSHGEVVSKTAFINAVQSGQFKYEAFSASDIKVRIYRDTAVATCLWSSRATFKGQSLSNQMRVMHIYLNGGNGWKVLAAQASALPPYTASAL
jgi:ketosteroid isomerase-like protein